MRIEVHGEQSYDEGGRHIKILDDLGQAVRIQLLDEAPPLYLLQSRLLAAYTGQTSSRTDELVSRMSIAVAGRLLFLSRLEGGGTDALLYAPTDFRALLLEIEEGESMTVRRRSLCLYGEELEVKVSLDAKGGVFKRSLIWVHLTGTGPVLLLSRRPSSIITLGPEETCHVNPDYLLGYSANMKNCLSTYGNRRSAINMPIQLCFSGPGRLLLQGHLRLYSPDSAEGGLAHRALKRIAWPYDIFHR